MIPYKLKKGDEIRVVSPSLSLIKIPKKEREIAKIYLEDLGYKITFSKNSEEKDLFGSSSIESRVDDLHEAFKDAGVKMVLASRGGFNSNQILKYLDYDLIKANPKIICGFSDITALTNAIYEKTGLVTYSGPTFWDFTEKGLVYTTKYFKKALVNKEPFKVNPSKRWYDKRQSLNKGHIVINEGETEGTIIGGNQCTLNLLQGTEFMPSLKDSILFLEDDSDIDAKYFDRDLQSLIHLPDFEGVKGIVIGRFQRASKISNKEINKIIKSKKELQNIPIIANADFGHTAPLITFPIGGRAKIKANKSAAELYITAH